MSPIPNKVHDQLVLTLTNLRLAALCADFLMEAGRCGVKEMPTELVMRGPRRSVRLPSTNCGFFVTPVIHCALLDVRRTLEFFMLRADTTQDRLVSMAKKRYPDDFSITDLGLPAVDPSVLLGISVRVTGGAPTKSLLQVCTYTNKDMAHFSATANVPDLQSVADSAKIIHEAIVVLVYEALKIDPPKLQPTIHDG